jgi:hypothetical protein
MIKLLLMHAAAFFCFLSISAVAAPNSAKKDFVSFKSDNEKDYLDAYRAQYLKLASAYKTGNLQVKKSSALASFIAHAELVLKVWTEAPALKAFVAKTKAIIGIRTVVPSTPVIFYTLNTSGTLPVVGLRLGPIADPDSQLSHLVWEFGDSTVVTDEVQDDGPVFEHVRSVCGRHHVVLQDVFQVVNVLRLKQVIDRSWRQLLKRSVGGRKYRKRAGVGHADHVVRRLQGCDQGRVILGTHRDAHNIVRVERRHAVVGRRCALANRHLLGGRVLVVFAPSDHADQSDKCRNYRNVSSHDALVPKNGLGSLQATYVRPYRSNDFGLGV